MPCRRTSFAAHSEFAPAARTDSSRPNPSSPQSSRTTGPQVLSSEPPSDDRVVRFPRSPESRPSSQSPRSRPALEGGYALVTGGAGFIGSNLAERLLSEGQRVVVLDSFVRPNVERNISWLKSRHSNRLEVIRGDVRDANLVNDCVANASQVFHFAAQVAVTTSVSFPRADFDVNACGTLNVLEALRKRRKPPPLLFTSTNKVYGSFDSIPLQRRGTRYIPEHAQLAASGIAENRNLDFQSPYGCSKGAADQYVLDYCRTFGLPAVVFRMSCIYGPRQFGTEDQGWVAHFLLRALRGETIVIYGDGCQVRDLLFIDDLLDAILLARDHMPRLSGAPFNIGGGPGNAVSLLDVLHTIEQLIGERPVLEFANWRVGDQRYYVSDTTKFESLTGWRRQVNWQDGLGALAEWLKHSLSEPVADQTAIGFAPGAERRRL